MKNHRGSLASMMESVPGSLDIGEPHPVPGLVNACLAELDWVQEGGATPLVRKAMASLWRRSWCRWMPRRSWPPVSSRHANYTRTCIERPIMSR